MKKSEAGLLNSDTFRKRLRFGFVAQIEEQNPVVISGADLCRVGGIRQPETAAEGAERELPAANLFAIVGSLRLFLRRYVQHTVFNTNVKIGFFKAWRRDFDTEALRRLYDIYGRLSGGRVKLGRQEVEQAAIVSRLKFYECHGAKRIAC